jgi:tetratricopeptide (TPR) repeat protein
MSLKLRCIVAAWAMAGILTGCYPGAESQRDEERNPYYLAGKDRVTAKDYRGAIEAFEKALENNPRSALAHYELGVIFDQHANDYPAAIYHYGKVLKLRPSGAYPAELAKSRIPSCKQEMVKADSLAMVNPTALQELERLREDKQKLEKQLAEAQQQIENLKLAAAGRPPIPSTPGTGQNQAPPAGAPGSATTNPSSANRPGPSTPGRAPAGPMRQHTVKARETATSIAKQYGIPLKSLLSANPGLVPTQMKPGQTVNIPSS